MFIHMNVCSSRESKGLCKVGRDGHPGDLGESCFALHSHVNREQKSKVLCAGHTGWTLQRSG